MCPPQLVKHIAKPQQSLCATKCLPISFTSSPRTLPLMAALGLPSHKINWRYVTNFNGMKKMTMRKKLQDMKINTSCEH